MACTQADISDWLVLSFPQTTSICMTLDLIISFLLNSGEENKTRKTIQYKMTLLENTLGNGNIRDLWTSKEHLVYKMYAKATTVGL